MSDENETTSERKTVGELYGPAMEITDPDAAKIYFDTLVGYVMEHHKPAISMEEAASIVKQNLGYYAGYYSNETRLRVEELFQCSHPVFGKAEEREVTPEGAFAAGMYVGGTFHGGEDRMRKPVFDALPTPDHTLKSWPEYFVPVWEGHKTFEIRKNDRYFREGDIVLLEEWVPENEQYTGRKIRAKITYMTQFEQQEGFVVFSLSIHEKIKGPA